MKLKGWARAFLKFLLVEKVVEDSSCISAHFSVEGVTVRNGLRSPVASPGADPGFWGLASLLQDSSTPPPSLLHCFLQLHLLLLLVPLFGHQGNQHPLNQVAEAQCLFWS